MRWKKMTAFILAAMILCQQNIGHWTMQVHATTKCDSVETPLEKDTREYLQKDADMLPDLEQDTYGQIPKDDELQPDQKAESEVKPEPLKEQDDNDENSYEAAEQSFAALVDDHDVYALLYHCESYDIRKAPAADSGSEATILTGHQVRLTGIAFAAGELWYQAEAMVNGAAYNGYIEEAYLISADEGLKEWKDSMDNASPQRNTPFFSTTRSSTNLNAFPASYRPYIQALLKAHPNWTFVPMNTNLNWNTVIQQEMTPARNLVPLDSMESWKMSNQVLSAPYWVQASESIVRYYIDPRNFLNEDSVFQFEMLSFNSACHTEAGVKTILKNTFMANATLENGLSYAQNFMEIGKTLNVSPYHLASRVRQEQGNDGSSPLISGTYPGYEGLYNYYNILASGITYEEIIRNGLEEARAAGWTTRYAALFGGSQKVSNNYIKIGQNTLYLQKFDVDNSDGNLYWHQYMQNLLAADNEGKSVKKGYANMGVLNNSFLFRVPVYQNMPASPCQLPVDSLAAPSLSVSISGFQKITLKWKEIPGAQGYQIYRSAKANKGFKKVGTISSGGTVSWADSVGFNKTYYYKIRSYRHFNGINIYSPYSSVKKASTKLSSPKMASLTLSSQQKITVKWEKMKGVTGYRIYRKTGKSGTYKAIKKLKGANTASYADKDISPNNTYYYKIRAYKTVGKKEYYSPYSNVIASQTTLSKPTIRSVSAVSPTKAKLSWKKTAGAQGYQIYRATSYKGKYTKVRTVTKGSLQSCTDTNLTPNKTYYYKIRAYRTVNKTTKYSKFSSVTSITPCLQAPEMISISAISTDRAKISWQKADGAQGYRLYRAASRKGPYKLVKTTSGSSYTDTGLAKGKTYYYKVRAYVKVSGSYRYSGYSNPWSVQTKK